LPYLAVLPDLTLHLQLPALSRTIFYNICEFYMNLRRN
jgi:hypothetical protein